MKRFRLQSGHVIRVDDADAYLLRTYVWAVHTRSWGIMVERAHNGSQLSLARYLMDAGPGDYVTYRDRDPLNLQRSNLLVLSKTEFHRYVASLPARVPAPCA